MNEIETIVSEMPPQNRAGSVLGLYDCALDALRRGFKGLPLMPRTKKPAARLVAHGCAHATTSEALVRQWWSEYPELPTVLSELDLADSVGKHSSGVRGKY